jgi:RIP homotypic interaction motif
MAITGGERMEPISLILTALAAGASAGALEVLKDDVKEKAKAAYAKLHGLVKKRVAGRPDAELALERYPSAPKKWEAVLTDELTEAGAAEDSAIVAAATALMDIVDRAGAKSGKYNVTIKDAKGVQVGDGNFQVNRF